MINPHRVARPNSPTYLLRRKRHVAQRHTDWLPIPVPKQWLPFLLPHWLPFTLPETTASMSGVGDGEKPQPQTQDDNATDYEPD